MRRFFVCFVFAMALVPALIAQITPFTCKGQVFVTLAQRFYDLSVTEDAVASLYPFSQAHGLNLNAIGYNPADNFIYGIVGRNSRYAMYRFGREGTGQLVVDSLPVPNSNTGSHFKAGYFCGDITRDGKYWVFVGDQSQILTGQERQVIYRLDLNSPTYEIKQVLLQQEKSFADVAFHPLTQALWAYDGTSGQFFTIDYLTGAVSALGSVNGERPEDIAALAWGSTTKMVGVNNDNLGFLINSINYHTQLIVPRLAENDFKGLDACACPYTIVFEKLVNPAKTYPCTTVEYAFIISNLSYNPQTGATLNDTLPSGFEIVEITKNPFGGTASGIGTNVLSLSAMELGNRIDTLKIKVRIPVSAEGEYPNQAFLGNLDLLKGNDTRTKIPSNFPYTVEVDDPTPLQVQPWPDGMAVDTVILCADTSIYVEAAPISAISNWMFEWESGATSAGITVSESGHYQVTMTTDCGVYVKKILVLPSQIALVLEKNYFQTPGDTLLLQPQITGGFAPYDLRWKIGTISGNCQGCDHILYAVWYDTDAMITATDKFGCKAYKSAKIKTDLQVFAANAFGSSFPSPNNRFFLQSATDQLITLYEVFDRWGNKVFSHQNLSTNDASTGWDGTYKGKPCLSGIYTWVAEITLKNSKKKVLSGDVLWVN